MKLHVYLTLVSTAELVLILRLSTITILMPAWCRPPKCSLMVIIANVHRGTLGHIAKVSLVNVDSLLNHYRSSFSVYDKLQPYDCN